MSRKIVKIAVGVGFLVIIYSLINQITITLRSGDRLDQALSKLHQLEIRNRELKDRLRVVNSPGFLEAEARDRLGLVLPGETLVVISDERINSVLGATEPPIEHKLPNWQGWFKLFIK